MIMEENSKYEVIAMNIIASAGETRSLCIEALREAREDNFDKAEEMLNEAEQAIHDAHQAQMDLLVQEANGEKAELSILLIHAQDHFMTSLLALDLAREIIALYKKGK